VFSPPDSCYECTLSEADFEALAYRQSCRLLSYDQLLEGKVPTTATTSSIVAGIQAQEVVKLLHRDRDGVRPLNGAMVFDGANNDLYPITYPFDKNCLAHHTYLDATPWDAPEGADFADAVRASGWDTAIVELGDDYLVGWNCGGCGAHDDDARAVSLVRFGDATCPHCGEPRQPEVVSSIAVPGERASTTLSAVGLRADEILAIRNGLDYRYVWVQSAPLDFPKEWA
jgi:adenylyltransferase/sulfurtransferase